MSASFTSPRSAKSWKCAPLPYTFFFFFATLEPKVE